MPQKQRATLSRMENFNGGSKKKGRAEKKQKVRLNGRQAAWAARKYKGHRVLPESLMDDLEKANIV